MEAEVAISQRRKILDEVLNCLDDEELAVVWWHMRGIGTRHIGELIGKTHPGVLWIEKRAFGKLRELLAARGVTQLSDLVFKTSGGRLFSRDRILQRPVAA